MISPRVIHLLWISQLCCFCDSEPLNVHPSKAWKKILNPSKSESKSYSIFHSSTCYECAHFNKEDHLPQNSGLLTSSVFQAANCFNLDRHLVSMFSTTHPTPTSTHMSEQIEEMFAASRIFKCFTFKANRKKWLLFLTFFAFSNKNNQFYKKSIYVVMLVWKVGSPLEWWSIFTGRFSWQLNCTFLGLLLVLLPSLV